MTSLGLEAQTEYAEAVGAAVLYECADLTRRFDICRERAEALNEGSGQVRSVLVDALGQPRDAARGIAAIEDIDLEKLGVDEELEGQVARGAVAGILATYYEHEATATTVRQRRLLTGLIGKQVRITAAMDGVLFVWENKSIIWGFPEKEAAGTDVIEGTVVAGNERDIYGGELKLHGEKGRLSRKPTIYEALPIINTKDYSSTIKLEIFGTD